MRLRLALTALLAAALPAAVAGVAGASSSSYYNLAGHWTTPGTSLTLTQKGRTIEWTGGPDDHAWIQTFTGTIADASFSGEFRQDEPGHLPPRYHGTMKAKIEDSCHFMFLEIVQVGQETLHGIEFTKQPCVVVTPGLAHLTLVLFRKRYVPPGGTVSCPSSFECIVRNHATVTICNHDDFNHDPFALASGNQFDAGTRKILLKPGQCFSKRLVNKTSEAIRVKLYDRIHSQERFIVTVKP